MKRSLSRVERIRGRKDIRNLFFSKSNWTVSGCKLRIRSNGLSFCRILVSTEKKFGNSVQRNYMKRVGREVFRSLKTEIEPGWDLVFVFFSGEYTFQERKNQIANLLRKAGLMCRM